MSFAPTDPFRAIALKVTSVLAFVIMASFIKAASAEVPPGQTVFFRSLFALQVIMGWLALRGQLRDGLKTRNPLGHLWRGLIGTMAMGMSFAGLAILPLYEVKAIQYAMPLFVVILAALVLGETVRKVRLTAVGMGMVGVLIILWPRLSAFTGGDEIEPALAMGALIVLTGSFCAALAQVFVRRLVESEDAAAIVFYFSVTATLLSLATLPFGWVQPSWSSLGFLLGAGLVGGTGQILLTSSYRYADASIIAPFEYSSMLFAIAIGLIFFDEVPTPMMLFGAAVVIAAGVLIILRERYLRIQRGKARRVVTKYG